MNSPEFLKLRKAKNMLVELENEFASRIGSIRKYYDIKWVAIDTCMKTLEEYTTYIPPKMTNEQIESFREILEDLRYQIDEMKYS